MWLIWTKLHCVLGNAYLCTRNRIHCLCWKFSSAERRWPKLIWSLSLLLAFDYIQKHIRKQIPTRFWWDTQQNLSFTAFLKSPTSDRTSTSYRCIDTQFWLPAEDHSRWLVRTGDPPWNKCYLRVLSTVGVDWNCLPRRPLQQNISSSYSRNLFGIGLSVPIWNNVLENLSS